MGATLIVGLVIALLASGLGVADYMLQEQENPLYPVAEEIPPDFQVGASSSSSSSVDSSAPPSIPSTASSSSHPTVIKKGTSTKKQTGVIVGDIFDRLGLTAQATTESSFLEALASANAGVQVVALLKDNDRAFLFSWLEHDEVKSMFSSLKQALQERFSGKVTDLIDETRSSADGPPVDVLSFFDPSLSAEKIFFLRVRNRLYEIHVAKNGEGVLGQLVEELSK